jgi:hypothetical protein
MMIVAERRGKRKIKRVRNGPSHVAFSSPVVVRLADYPCRHAIHAVRREWNPITRQWLTLAVADFIRPGFIRPHPVRDVVTLLRLADLLKALGRHDLPENPDSAYGVPRWSKERGDKGAIE